MARGRLRSAGCAHPRPARALCVLLWIYSSAAVAQDGGSAPPPRNEDARATREKKGQDPDPELLEHLEEIERLELLQNLELFDPQGDFPPEGKDGGSGG